jgi:hypothetical protein
MPSTGAVVPSAFLIITFPETGAVWADTAELMTATHEKTTTNFRANLNIESSEISPWAKLGFDAKAGEMVY